MSQPSQHTSPPAAEPSEQNPPLPIWLIVLMVMLLFVGGLYFDDHGGWFSPQVYAPYRSVEEIVTFQPVQGAGEDLLRQGKIIFQTCAACHMDSGLGNPANGCPPLAGSEWVKTPGIGRMVRIISKGLTGPIQVKGQPWSSGAMLAIGDQLSGDEKEKAEKIAAVIYYVRHTFGDQKSPPPTPEQVSAIRSEIKGHPLPFTAPELLAVPEDK